MDDARDARPTRTWTAWRMFYTGLNMGEQGRIQRIGMARSSRPLLLGESHRDTATRHHPGRRLRSDSVDEVRHWVSFRDPFYMSRTARVLLIAAAARVNHGPITRGGGVALARGTRRSVRLHPRLPPRALRRRGAPTLVRLNGRLLSLGSIREDVKLDYWWADEPTGYRNFHDNVFFRRAITAARCWYDDGCRRLAGVELLLQEAIRGEHLLPPTRRSFS